jgi:arabinofuranan 3-O-arabinosyltransferase
VPALTMLAGVQRRATALSLAVLTVLAFLQKPGQVTFDTKLDLVVDPAGFLDRATHLWNPQATSGELQNQAYGYLFPMGPFFAVAQAIGLPMWIAQRIWCALLLAAGYLGLLLLARAMRIGSEPTRQVAALAYALAPRMLTEVGSLSAEMLPAVLLPWVLLPLVAADRVGSPRRAAGLSALAVLAMGGVNGAMVLMALVLPGLWLLTRRFTADHARLFGWWCLAVAACLAWWFAPLLLLGRYSLPFLNYIESSANTTAVVSLFQAVRGTNQWVAYVVQGEPWWPAGFVLVDNPVLMAATIAIAAVGLAGLVRSGLPERRFLVLAVLTGLALLTVGYVGSLDSPLATTMRHLLDGPLAPFRNVHKFEPVLRLPLALGFAHGAALGVKRWSPWRRAVPALLLVIVAAAPAWLLILRPGPGWSDVPGYWRQAATWLGEHDRTARTLVVPASGFGNYTWGRTIDEPLQGLAQAPWAVRSQIPLGSEGNTRVMDAVEEVLDSGRGSPGLADFLARSGYRYVLLRNDIDRPRAGAPPIVVLRQALTGSPGLDRVATFGPTVRPDKLTASPVDRYGTQPATLEIYEVRHPAPLARAVVADDVATVSGGPESLLPLLDQGLLESDRPAVLAGDLGDRTPGSWFVTDGLRKRERNTGRVRDNLSQTLTADEGARQSRSTLDILPFPADDHETVAVLQGARSISASTSASYADAYGSSEPGYQPFAAIDGDPNTAWHSSSLVGPVGQWLEVRLDTPRGIDHVDLTFVSDLRVGWPVTRFRLGTDTGSIDYDVPSGEDGKQHTYKAPAGLTGTVRVTVLAVAAGRSTGNVGISELRIGDLAASRALRVPDDVTGRPGQVPVYSFSRGYDARSSCYPVDRTTMCDPRLNRTGEEPGGVDRLFRTPVAAHYDLALTALPRPGGSIPLQNNAISLSASSWLDGNAGVAPYAAMDGNIGTAWVAGLGDLQPSLTLKWSGARRIDRIKIDWADPDLASMPSLLEVIAPRQTRLVQLDGNGVATFAALTTDQLQIRIRDLNPASVDTGSLPPGIGELEIPALSDLIEPVNASSPVSAPCGQGPAIVLDGKRYDTAVSGTIGDLIAQNPLPVTICDLFLSEGIDLPAGEHVLRTDPSAPFVVQDAALRPAGFAPAGLRQRQLNVQHWDSGSRTVHIGPGVDALLVVAENANPGWVAELNGRRLPPARVDGWQQAWQVPAGDGGTIQLTFAPDRAYRDSLAGGGLSALAVVALVALPIRRRPMLKPAASRSPAIAVALIGLLLVLGGVLPVVLLIAAMLVRQLRAGSLRILAPAAAGVAAAVAVTGRLLGYGQDWAYGGGAQAAMLVAIAGVAASCIPPPGERSRSRALAEASTPTSTGERSRSRALAEALGGGPLDEDAAGDQQRGGSAGGAGDLGDAAVQQPPDGHDLGADRDPEREDRAGVLAGDSGVHQHLRDGQQRAGEREDNQWGGHPGVARAAEQAQQAWTEQAGNDDRRVQADDDRQRDPDDAAPVGGLGQVRYGDDPDGLRQPVRDLRDDQRDRVDPGLRGRQGVPGQHDVEVEQHHQP